MRYATKAEWASAKAEEVRQKIAELQITNTMGRPSAARVKRDDMAFFRSESRRFENLARRYKEQGV